MKEISWAKLNAAKQRNEGRKKGKKGIKKERREHQEGRHDKSRY
jgi:hypothetical protein